MRFRFHFIRRTGRDQVEVLIMPIFFDTHAHLGGNEFIEDLEAVVKRATEAGISTIITVGTDLAGSQRAIQIAEQFPNIYAAVGWHPTDLAPAPEDVRPGLRPLLQHPKVVAIGEIGLDFYRFPRETPENAAELARVKERQAQVFVQQLELAAESGLNCVVHARSAVNEALALIKPFEGRTQCVFHCFSEGPESLRKVLASGSMTSYTGVITYKKTEAIQRSVAAVPSDRIMLETDCPFLSPVPHRGTRCEPSMVSVTAKAVAAIRGVTLEELSAQTCENARRFFRKMKV